MEKGQQGEGLPLIGDEFPELDVNTTEGEMKLPNHFTNQWFVLFSHPADFTPVCTTEFASFAKKYDQFQELNCGLIGLSIDQVFSHIKWVEWIEDELDQEIPFPVIADDTGKVASRLGMVHPGKGTNTVRAVFIVDDSGVVRTILYYPQEMGRNMNEILRTVRGLQLSDRENVAIPANWPENEIIGDEVIVKPPTARQVAEKRSEQYDCYDWWFCHRKAE